MPKMIVSLMVLTFGLVLSPSVSRAQTPAGQEKLPNYAAVDAILREAQLAFEEYSLKQGEIARTKDEQKLVALMNAHEQYLLKNLIPKNLQIIKRIDDVLPTASPKERSVLLNTRAALVGQDKDARKDLQDLRTALKDHQKIQATAKASGKPAPLPAQLPPDLEALLQAAGEAPKIVPAIRQFDSGQISAAQYEKIINEKLYEPTLKLQNELRTRRVVAQRNKHYVAFIDEELAIVGLMVEAGKAALRYSKTKSRADMEIVSKNFITAGNRITVIESKLHASFMPQPTRVPAEQPKGK